jgi:hypothetical protein
MRLPLTSVTAVVVATAAMVGFAPVAAYAADSNICPEPTTFPPDELLVEETATPIRLLVDDANLPNRLTVCFIVPSGIAALPTARGAVIVTAPAGSLPGVTPDTGTCTVTQFSIPGLTVTTGFDSVTGTACIAVNNERLTVSAPTNITPPTVEVWRDGRNADGTDDSILALALCSVTAELERRLGNPDAETNFANCRANDEKLVG